MSRIIQSACGYVLLRCVQCGHYEWSDGKPATAYDLNEHQIKAEDGKPKCDGRHALRQVFRQGVT